MKDWANQDYQAASAGYLNSCLGYWYFYKGRYYC